ncbi:hypothetical protein [Herbaspirillum aquaticum]|jgi:hypothetical protein|uniref:hypothetical protein n=1 Tax=Herbaspirillum aquaticum TaxID=568783 RepID=UPI0013038145|nr:hypothetical protein [Herbaspirillum aquaticum]
MPHNRHFFKKPSKTIETHLFNNKVAGETGRIKFWGAMPLMSDKLQAKICLSGIDGQESV